MSAVTTLQLAGAMDSTDFKSLKEKWDSPEWRAGLALGGDSDKSKGEGSWVATKRLRNQGATKLKPVATSESWKKSSAPKQNPQLIDKSCKLPVDDHKQKILDHVRANRITFIQVHRPVSRSINASPVTMQLCAHTFGTH